MSKVVHKQENTLCGDPWRVHIGLNKFQNCMSEVKKKFNNKKWLSYYSKIVISKVVHNQENTLFRDPCRVLAHCTKVRFASFYSGEFIKQW